MYAQVYVCLCVNFYMFSFKSIQNYKYNTSNPEFTYYLHFNSWAMTCAGFLSSVIVCNKTVVMH